MAEKEIAAAVKAKEERFALPEEGLSEEATMKVVEQGLDRECEAEFSDLERTRVRKVQKEAKCAPSLNTTLMKARAELEVQFGLQLGKVNADIHETVPMEDNAVLKVQEERLAVGATKRVVEAALIQVDVGIVNAAVQSHGIAKVEEERLAALKANAEEERLVADAIAVKTWEDRLAAEATPTPTSTLTPTPNPNPTWR